ncbi:MAG: protein kinase [Ruminococcus sp.]|nr:protein kinase [Ruminococcus sp.]
MNKNELEKIILNQLNKKFDIVGKIGEGLHSTVYRTADYALKIKTVIFSENACNMAEKSYAMTEINIMKLLADCPNIVAYRGGGAEKIIVDNKYTGDFFIIKMDFLNCLSEMIKSGNFILCEKNIVRLATDICRALCHMHGKNIVHCDIKSDNFFCRDSGEFLLGDFSVSDFADRKLSRSGSRRYTAPEILDGRKVDYFQADIYSLGISLYELANNLYIPFEDKIMDSRKAVELRTRGSFFPRPLNATAGFSEIIMKACAFDLEKRYKKAEEMLYDLENLKAGGYVTYEDIG